MRAQPFSWFSISTWGTVGDWALLWVAADAVPMAVTAAVSAARIVMAILMISHQGIVRKQKATPETGG